MKDLHSELRELASRLYVVFTLSAESTLVNKAADAIFERDRIISELREKLEASERLRALSHEDEERIAKMYNATLATLQLHNRSREAAERELRDVRGKLATLAEAANELFAASEECVFDDNIGHVAGDFEWTEFMDVVESVTVEGIGTT